MKLLIPLLLPLVLLSASFSLPREDEEWITMQFPAITNIYLLPGNEVFLFHADGSTTWLPGLENLRFEGWSGNEPIIASSVNVVVGPHQLETEYTDKEGFTHRIITKCGQMNPDACAKRHYEQVVAVVKLFPFAVGNGR